MTASAVENSKPACSIQSHIDIVTEEQWSNCATINCWLCALKNTAQMLRRLSHDRLDAIHVASINSLDRLDHAEVTRDVIHIQEGYGERNGLPVSSSAGDAATSNGLPASPSMANGKMSDSDSSLCRPAKSRSGGDG